MPGLRRVVGCTAADVAQGKADFRVPKVVCLFRWLTPFILFECVRVHVFVCVYMGGRHWLRRTRRGDGGG